MEFIKPVWCSDNILNGNGLTDAEISFIENCVYTEDMYQHLLGEGWRPEQAREVLPNSIKTEIVVKANLREWQHILTLRTSKKAHPQMRALMLPLLRELQEKIPILFDNIEKST